MQTRSNSYWKLALALPVGLAMLGGTLVSSAQTKQEQQQDQRQINQAKRVRGQQHRSRVEHAKLNSKLTEGSREQKQDMRQINVRRQQRKKYGKTPPKSEP